MRVKTYANLGAYMSLFSSSVPTYLYATLLSGQYNIPNIFAEVISVYTNTTPVDAYRGAGRPGGELLGRTADGDGGAATEGRSGRIAAEELHHQLPASDARDHGL